MDWINWLLYNIFGKIPYRLYIAGNIYILREIHTHNMYAWREKELIYDGHYEVLTISQFGFIVSLKKID